MKSVKRPVIALLVTLAMSAFTAFSQSGYQLFEDYRIKGTIKDALTKEPINATLVFESVPDASDVYIINAGLENGLYEVTIRSQSKYVVEITSDNYKPEIDTVLISGDLSGLNFELLSVKPGQLLRLHNIYFAQGDYQILDQSVQEISELVMLLNQYPEMIIRLEGHTDRLGGRRANMELSQSRVQEIKNYLINSGIHHKRIKTAAFGGNRPISTENNEESRRLNRRVEVRILSI
jgi:outer membrane protein OmpA-like peptidoglycan-associated protein